MSSTLRGLCLIVRRSLRQHMLSTCITAASVALGAGLLMAIVSIQSQTHSAFAGGAGGFDAVLGARSSQLQLVLNSVFHLEQSPGNLPWKMYREIAENPAVAEAIPIAVGDNYHNFRIVGTVPELFTRHHYAQDSPFAFQPGGRVFDAQRAEAVVGSFAARRAGLSVGSTFHSYHGLTFDPSQQHAMVFTVVGVLEPSNTPADRAIWVPLEAYYRMPGHSLHGSGVQYVPQPGEVIPDEHKEVSAVLLKLRSSQTGFMLEQLINRQGNVATLAWPIGKVLADLFSKLGWVHEVLTLVAGMVIVVAVGSILASVYNAMRERRREIAIMRSLGARRRVVFAAVVLESATLAAFGALLGFVVYAILLAFASVLIREKTGVVLEVWRPHVVMLITPVLVTLLGAIAGMVPAVKAYATDVASHLQPIG